MMITIVERLRSYAKNQGEWHNIDDTCEEAANELDRLYKLELDVRKPFNNYWGITEYPNSNNEFHPVTISCCRTMMIAPLGKLLKRIRGLSLGRWISKRLKLF
jgi:hypothetical protein